MSQISSTYTQVTASGHHRTRIGADYERYRNEAIQGIREIRNSFIDHPELAKCVDFSREFAS